MESLEPDVLKELLVLSQKDSGLSSDSAIIDLFKFRTRWLTERINTVESVNKLSARVIGFTGIAQARQFASRHSMPGLSIEALGCGRAARCRIEKSAAIVQNQLDEIELYNLKKFLGEIE